MNRYSRLLVVVVAALVITACTAPSEHVATVEEMKIEPGYIDQKPPYRVDCGVTIQGTLDCGYNFFIFPVDETVPDAYWLKIRVGECTFWLEVSAEEYNQSHVGGPYRVFVKESTAKRCLPGPEFQVRKDYLPPLG